MGGGSEFVEQHWQDGSVGIGEEKVGKALLKNILSSDPDWKLQLQGTLKIRTLDDYIGQEIVELEQDVVIMPDSIESKVNLVEGSKRLLGYAMSTSLVREENHTRVELWLTQEIKTDAPWFAHGIADRRVRNSAERALANQETAMRRLIEENGDKAGLFPLR